jgi:hypothetical protein
LALADGVDDAEVGTFEFVSEGGNAPLCPCFGHDLLSKMKKAIALTGDGL